MISDIEPLVPSTRRSRSKAGRRATAAEAIVLSSTPSQANFWLIHIRPYRLVAIVWHPNLAAIPVAKLKAMRPDFVADCVFGPGPDLYPAMVDPTMQSNTKKLIATPCRFSP